MEFSEWMQNFVIQLPTHFQFFGVFLISFVGALSIIVPIPYTVVIFMLGMQQMDPIMLAVAGGLGSAAGEFSGYVLGYYGRGLISDKRRKKMEYLTKILGRYGPAAIFIFALTPLPDDLLFIPLGFLRYSFVKIFIPCFLGKLLMCYLLAHFGRIGGEAILFVFGEENIWLGTAVTAVLLTVVLLVLFKVDWEKIFERHVGMGEKRKECGRKGNCS
ncbi:MAG: VTT domain-containing protein [Thermoproteota archaeon]|nr:VTT domain-containing protein [Thermoproteota archaeon]